MPLKIYNGSFYGLLRRFERKQQRAWSPSDTLPPWPDDLTPLRTRLLTEAVPGPEATQTAAPPSVFTDLHAEFIGQSELLFHHAVLIAMSRRRPLPADVARKFLRLWSEQGDWLAQNLVTRWRISAATTFGEIGSTADQRALGMGLSILFDMTKLYETERSLNGRSGAQLGRRLPVAERPELPLGLAPYAIARGDLDRNMLARLFALSENDQTIRPLAQAMLSQIMEDPSTIFARMQRRKGIDPTEDGIA